MRQRVFSLVLFCTFAIILVISLISSAPALATTADGLVQQPSRTPKAGDPVNMGNGQEEYSQNLFALPGPLPLVLNINYLSQSALPSDLGDGYNLNIPQLWVINNGTEIIATTTFINDLDEIEFNWNDPNWEVNSNTAYPYELKAAGDNFFLKDPVKNRVYYFEKATNVLWLCRTIEDRSGNRITYNYTAYNNKYYDGISSIVSSSGMGLDIVMREFGVAQNTYWRITEISTQATPKRSWSFSYTEATGLLTKMTDPEGGETLCNMNAHGKLSSLTLPEGNTPYTNEYTLKEFVGSSGSISNYVVSKQTTASGDVTDFTYDFNSGTTTETRPDGNQNIFTCVSTQGDFTTAAGAPSNITLAGGATLDFTQDANGNLNGGTTAEGASFGLTRDAASGQAASITLGTKQMNFTYENSSQSFNGLNSDSANFNFRNKTGTTFPGGIGETKTYDSHGRLTRSTDACGGQTVFTYTGEGQLATVTDPLGAESSFTYNAQKLPASATSPISGTTNYVYDDFGNLTGITNLLGQITTATYDDLNRITSITAADGSQTTVVYDRNGNPTQVTAPNSGITTTTYDVMDRPTTITNPTGESVTFTYDNMGRVKTATGPDGIVTTKTYDAGGNLIKNERAGLTWEGLYNNDRMLIRQSDDSGYVLNYSYNDVGDPTRISDNANRTWDFAYDIFGNLLKATDPLARETDYDYDNMGRLIETTRPGGAVASYTRNLAGSLESITEPGGGIWNMTYDSAGRLSKIRNPLNYETSWGYDTLGRLETTTFADTTVVTYQYDALDRIKKISSGLTDINYTYDALENLATTTGLANNYDLSGRLISTTSANTTTTLTRNAKGQLTSVNINPPDITINYTYDLTSGKIISISDSQGLAQVDFTYDNAGRISGITRKNGVATNYTYKPNRSLLASVSDGTFTDLSFTYDALDRVTSVDATLPLDPAQFLSNDNQNLSFNEMNQTTAPGFAYDQLGRMTQAPNLNLVWDNFSRITGVNDAVNQYDGLSRLIATTLDGETTNYSYCAAVTGQMPIRVATDTGDWIQAIHPSLGLIFSIRTNTAGEKSARYYHFDRSGSTVAVTDALGDISAQFAWSPYGELLATTGSDLPPFRFLGRYGCHMVIGSDAIYRHGVRCYHPATAQFISPEMDWPDLQKTKRLNIYNYAASDPANFVDYNGFEEYFSDILPYDPIENEWEVPADPPPSNPKATATASQIFIGQLENNFLNVSNTMLMKGVKMAKPRKDYDADRRERKRLREAEKQRLSLENAAYLAVMEEIKRDEEAMDAEFRTFDRQWDKDEARRDKEIAEKWNSGIWTKSWISLTAKMYDMVGESYKADIMRTQYGLMSWRKFHRKHALR